LLSEHCASDNQARTTATAEANSSDHSLLTQDDLNDNDQKNFSGTCISLNSASSKELQQLSGVGEKRAADIIQNRPFTNIDDLLNIDGIGEVSLAQWRDSLCL
jgi:competence ComEA-like helix-hairpin-helix protein